MDFSGVYIVTFSALSAPGVVSVAGVKEGDIILKIWGGAGGAELLNLSSGYRVLVETDDELYQNDGDWTAYSPLTALVLRR